MLSGTRAASNLTEAVSRRLEWIILGAATILCLGACKPSASPASTSRQPVDAYTEARRAAWLAGRSSSCRLIVDSMRRETGEGTLACSEGRTTREAIACAKHAFDRKRPFTLCDSGWGMDSYFENGVAGLADGNILIYYLDTFGPRYRGTCLRPNVSFATNDWPQCRTALIHQIDLQTGHGYVERAELPNEEKWPQSCADIAVRAPRWSVGVQLVTGENPLPNPERWGLRCKEAVVTFEMLIDKTGRVTCARIVSVGLRAPVPGLYASIRLRLLRWRFKPPTLHGEPLNVRWGMQINTIRKGESFPGPPIYPACP